MSDLLPEKRPHLPDSVENSSSPEESSSEEATINSIDLLQRIKAGILHPKSLSAEGRRSCTEHLLAEGLSDAAIGKILHVTDRTVRRDKRKIREQNAVVPRSDLLPEMVGRLMMAAEQAMGSFLRMARDKSVPPAVGLAAVVQYWRTNLELATKMQSLGYLPTATQKLQADLTHRIQGEDTLEEIHAEILRIEDVVVTSLPDDAASHAELKKTKEILLRLETDSVAESPEEDSTIKEESDDDTSPT